MSYTKIPDAMTLDGPGGDYNLVPSSLTSVPDDKTNVPSAASGYAWDGNTNVAAMWIADAEHITLAGSDVASWTTQQAYTSGGTPTTYTLAQGDTGEDPEWESSGMNGQGSVLFDGAAEHLICTDADFVDLVTGNDVEMTAVLLCNVLSSSNGEHWYIWASDSNSNGYIRHIDVAGNYSLYRSDDGGTTSARGYQAIDTGANHVQTYRYEGINGRFYLDDVEDGSSPQNLNVGSINNPNTFTMGAQIRGSTTPNGFAHIRVAAWAVVRNDDTTAIQQIEDWMLTRGGI